MTASPLWLSRPLLNVDEVYSWLRDAGVKKAIPPEQLHLTLATVREDVEWQDLDLESDEIVIEAGEKPVQIFAWTIKALTFSHPDLITRHAELLSIYPAIDHPSFRPHLSLYKGGRMPKTVYTGALVFGPERAREFNPDNSQGIKHIKIADHLERTSTP